MIRKLRRRDGAIADFNPVKITNAIWQAAQAVGGRDRKRAEELTDKVVALLEKQIPKGEIPDVEQVQDLVEKVLIEEGHARTAKVYILYRQKHKELREIGGVLQDLDMVDSYLNQFDWRVKENSNMSYSLQGLNVFATDRAISHYWLHKIYPAEIGNAHVKGDFHIHDLGTLGPYTYYGKETVIAKLNRKILLTSFEKLYEGIDAPEELLSKVDNAWVKYPEDLLVLDKSGWTKTYRIVRKAKCKPMRFIKSEGERSVIVTEDHPMLLENGETKESKGVKVYQDKLLTVDIEKRLNNENLFYQKELFLAKELWDRGIKDFWIEGMPLEEYLKYSTNLEINGIISTSNNANSLPNWIELTENLGYLLGFYLAEGSMDSNGISIRQKDSGEVSKIVDRLKESAYELGCRLYCRKENGSLKLQLVNTTFVKYLLKSVFNSDGTSRGKCLPKEILTYDKKFIKGLIAGVLDGDGYLTTSKTSLVIRVASRTLLEQVATVLNLLGFTPRDRNLEGARTTHEFKGKGIIQNYPLFGIGFRIKGTPSLPSIKYNLAELSAKAWRAEGYGWHKVLNNEPTEIPDRYIYDITTESGTLLVNGMWNHNCVGWDLKDLLLLGFKGVRGKIESKPAHHFGVALMQIVNFLYTLQGEAAGAQALSNFDTLLAPFVRYDRLSYEVIKQEMQKFLFNMNVPTRVGFQSPFSNITMDLAPPNYMRDEPVIIGGEPQEDTYSDFQQEVDLINRSFAEVMLEGDSKERPFTFPIPTFNITRDFDWEDDDLEPIWKMTAKFGTPYFSNFINSDMKPEDARSMCCRLRLDKRELKKRGGGLFGSNPKTGSVGVVTLNMSRIGYLAKDEDDFLERLDKLMLLAKESLEIKREVIEGLTQSGLHPYSKFYLSDIKKGFGEYWKNHFSTIGLIGMNDALLNLMNLSIGDPEGIKFAVKTLEFMRKRIADFQQETGDIYNLEATPAESTSYRLAKIDKKLYPSIRIYNQEKYAGDGKGVEPYYTNSSQLPVGFTTDIFKALDLQDPLQTCYTGGCIEKRNKVLTDKGLLNIEYIVKNFKKLKPIKALSFNPEKKTSEWDPITTAVEINVKNKNKIRIKGERNLDVTTSDWHPFFVLEKIKVNDHCPICKQKVKNVKSFATHLRYSPECKEKYRKLSKYQVVERRADELKIGDYILQNSTNVYPEKESELTNDLAWLAGFFVGDGCISEQRDNRGGNNLKKYKLRFFSSSSKALGKAKAILSKYFNCQAKVIQNDKRSKPLRELTTSKKDVLKFFFDCGFKKGKKVYDISIPQRIKENLNKKNVKFLLSGLLDSDGHISKRDGDAEYYTVSEQLANDLLEICNKAGIMVTKRLKPTKKKNEVNIYRLRFPPYQVSKLELNSAGGAEKINPTLSNRKSRYLPVVRVKEISKANVADNNFYDLETKDNHNYLAGKDALVFIHNTVVHIFLGEEEPSPIATKKLIRKVAENYSLPYYTITPTFSICPDHGYIAGEHSYCPHCESEGKRTPCEVYSRVVGYLRPVEQWNRGKQQEFKDRKTFDMLSIKG
jgi:ribonucleoside-triphosphate reductase